LYVLWVCVTIIIRLKTEARYFVKTGLIETDYAKMLGHAFNSRVGSDYDVTFSPERRLAEEIIQDAHRFVARTEAYLQQTGIL
jgi:uncharacterized protein (UPF0332 family)